MGQNWIKMRKNLDSDPRVLAMSRALAVDIQRVLGALYLWFAYADEHGIADTATNDGTMPMVDYELIDSPQVTGLSGMANQLERVGWIKQEGDSLRVVNFQDHMGDGAKGRAMNAARQARRRTNVTHDALPDKTRQDETRGDEKAPGVRPACGGASWDPSHGFALDDKFRDSLAKAYPNLDIEAELRKAHAWKIANPNRRHKRIGRFVRGWMGKAQEIADEKPRDIRGGREQFDFNSLRIDE